MSNKFKSAIDSLDGNKWAVMYVVMAIALLIILTINGIFLEAGDLVNFCLLMAILNKKGG